MLKVAHGELVWNRDGVEIIWQPRYGVYEVWAPIADGPDDFNMDMIADCPDEADAIFYAELFIGEGTV
tara:strand:+ start:134 stop:337 length:204 start_codon:yes stop_codon:yes gene_type:complete